jgi:hypothetical protein
LNRSERHRQFHRTLERIRCQSVLIGLAATLLPAGAVASTVTSSHPWSFRLAAGLERNAPDARVREFDVRGSDLDLDDGPGLPDFGALGDARITRRLGAWRLGASLSVSRAAGQGDSGGGFAFNGGLFPPGRSVRARLTTTRITVDVSRRLAGSEGGTELRGIFALEHYHPVLTLEADPPIATHDRREDYLQFLPLPLLGAELDGPISRGQVHVRLQAGTAPDWDTGRSEGGPMRMTLTLAELEAGVSRPVSHSLRMSWNYVFRYAEGTLESAEDGNWIRSREHALLVGLELSG